MCSMYRHIVTIVASCAMVFSLALETQCIGNEVHGDDDVVADTPVTKSTPPDTRSGPVAKLNIASQSEDLISGKRSLLMSIRSAYSRYPGGVGLRGSGETRSVLRSMARTRQNLNRSMQSITNSVRSMNTSINSIRTYRRRF